MPKLGVNIDHVATVRQARHASVPDPVAAALFCEKAGCDSIVAHLREDRRHICDADVYALRRAVKTRFNLEMSIAPSIVEIACKVGPEQATLVPERRREVTTEGGLDVCRYRTRIRRVHDRLAARGIAVSLFINPRKDQIDASLATGARIIELHTGAYSLARSSSARSHELKRLRTACAYAHARGFEVNAGHGLDYANTHAVAEIPAVHELNIGHAIIARAVFVGITHAVKEMLERCR